MSGVNPQGCQVSSFKTPTSSEDLDHDYLWRCIKALPERGRIGIFNRSYYEETLVVRVHPEFLAGQKLPEECVTKNIWDERFQDIRASSVTSPQRHDRPQVFPPCLEEGAAEALSRAARYSGEELEVLGERREGAWFLG